MSDTPRLVVVAAFANVHEAQLAQSALDAAGIEAALDNEHLVSMNWMYSNLVGGVKVLVPDSQLNEARAILETTAVTMPNGESADEGVVYGEDVCKHCGGADFDSVFAGKELAVLSWLLLSFPIGLATRRRYCKRCGARAADAHD